jgi:hypothetical protein
MSSSALSDLFGVWVHCAGEHGAQQIEDARKHFDRRAVFGAAGEIAVQRVDGIEQMVAAADDALVVQVHAQGSERRQLAAELAPKH